MGKTLFDKLYTQLRSELEDQLSSPYYSFWRSFGSDHIETYKALDRMVAPDRRQLAIIRQLGDIRKKFIGKTSEKSATSAKQRDLTCWDKFLVANEASRNQNESFCDLDRDTFITLEYARESIEAAFWRRVESEESEFMWIHGSDTLFPVSGFSTGPGTCMGIEGTSTFAKYGEKWMFTSDVGRRYLADLRRFSRPLRDLRNYSATLESAVKASFVPKDTDTSRLIAPQLNGDLFLQYPACSFLEGMLSNSFSISLSDQQEINRTLAKNGSRNDNNDIFDHHLNRRRLRPCTIDLVSASDTVGSELVKYLVPKPLVDYMVACRCHSLVGPEDQVAVLEMFATMGNAFCFPLQTVIFASLVTAVYKRLGIPLYDKMGKPTYAVYGDDIIVDVCAYDHVIKVLKLLHMKPNVRKSFSHGFFRESCGVDYYDGYDVRPVYCQKLQDDGDIYSLANRLNDWGAKHSVRVVKSVALLLSAVKYKLAVPLDSGPHEGLRVPSAYLASLPKDWRRNVKACISIDVRLNSYPHLRGKFIKNVYDKTEVGVLRKKALTTVRNAQDCSSTFPFLRGGFLLIDESFKLDRSSFYRDFNERGFTDLGFGDLVDRHRSGSCNIEIPNKMGTKTIREVVQIPVWDLACNIHAFSDLFWNDIILLLA